MKDWLSKIGVPHLGLVMQVVMAAILGVSATVAYFTWQAGIGRQQTEATLRYFDKLTDHDYIRYMWEIEDFTLCFEREAKGHLTYLRYDAVKGREESLKLAARWWDQIENEHKRLQSCGKPVNIEEKLMLVYGRLEALASCAEQKLCSYTRIVDMIEAFDHMSVLAISNYLLLTRYPQSQISREWKMQGALVHLVEVIEKNVFEGRNSAAAHAALLDSRENVFDNEPKLKPGTLEGIHNKRTRCDTNDEFDAWKRCALPDKRDERP
jgi:hypothetical protein